MKALEKIRLMKDLELDPTYNEHFIDIFYQEPKWRAGEIESIQEKYPWLSDFYIKFIREFDSLSLCWAVFYGSEETNSLVLFKEIEYWREEGLPEEYFPFGKGPGGEVYCFNKKNEVIEFASDDYDFENPVVIATSLEDFIDQDLLGKRFAKWNNTETSSFYPFLKEQGWA